MKVQIHIDPGCLQPEAVLTVKALTPALQTAIAILEKEIEEPVLTAQRSGKVYVLDPAAVEVIRTEGRELVLYDRQRQRYVLNRPLYELAQTLGNDFIRISKSAIVQLRHIHHVEAAFNGTMEIVMKNGVEELITRSFRSAFKERLGVK